MQSYNLDADGAGLNVSLADAVEDTRSSESPTAPPTYDASLGNVLTTATGFVVETLEKGGVKLAISLLTQMVNGLLDGFSSNCSYGNTPPLPRIGWV